MSFSRWLKIDLHIHSTESNKTKSNDYDGEEYSASELIIQLKKSKVNIFSITDHNTLNVNLYEELEKMQSELEEKGMNFLIGVELDIQDKEISDEIFHCLLFFDCDKTKLEIETKKNLIKEMYLGGKIPSLNTIFSQISKYNYRNFILIPHYNNKSKGLKESKMLEKMQNPTLSLLNFSSFDAFEDTNNIKQIQKSLKKYKDAGYEDLPILFFSDNHNIEKYPESKSGVIGHFRYILGNINYPFNSLKLSFKEADLRMGFIQENIGRNIKALGKHITAITYNDFKMNMSPYQNTIIGGFGSGKSFFKDLLINGKNNLSVQYEEFLTDIQNFRINLSDGTEIKSLKESGCELLILDQNEEIFFSKVIDESYKNKLEEKFLLEFPMLEFNSEIERKVLDFFKIYDGFSSQLKSNVSEIINYETLFIKNDSSYQIIIENDDKLNVEEGNFNIDQLIVELEKEIEKKIDEKNIYNSDEIKNILNIKKQLKKKNLDVINFLAKHRKYLKYIRENIKKYNETHNEEKYLAQNKVKTGLLDYIANTIRSIKHLKIGVDSLMEELSEKNFEEFKNKTEILEYENYKLIAGFNPAKLEFESIEEKVLKKDYRKKGFFKGIIMTENKKETFSYNRTLKEQMITYYNDYFLENFKMRKYDIEINGKSIMKMSAGEKANNLIILLFEVLKLKEKNTIIIMDQPEDNLDNKNIYNKIVDKILTLKKLNKMPQIIFVTHNSNIAISSDSENIIIAKKNDKGEFEYLNSGIENKIIAEEICKILEGGVEALKKRGIKFAVPFIKEYEVN